MLPRAIPAAAETAPSACGSDCFPHSVAVRGNAKLPPHALSLLTLATRNAPTSFIAPSRAFDPKVVAAQRVALWAVRPLGVVRPHILDRLKHFQRLRAPAFAEMRKQERDDPADFRGFV